MLGLISVFLGGSIGASLRYLLSILSANFGFSYEGTFLVNIIGCLFLGFVTYIALKKEQEFNHHLKLFLTTGIAGGFTTFSTFSYEAFTLMQAGNTQTAIIYMLSSLFVGLIATGIGMVFAKLILGWIQSVNVSATQKKSVNTDLKDEAFAAKEPAEIS